MNVSSSARYSRLTEAAGVLSLIAGLLVWLSLVSYHPDDPSWNTAARVAHTRNLIGPAGAHLSDLFFQAFGALSFALPVVLVVLAWNWVRARQVQYPLGRAFGYLLFVLSSCSGFELGPKWTLFGGTVSSGGMIGVVLSDYLVSAFNITGASIVAFACFLVSLYLTSSFRIAHLSNVAALGSAAARPVASRWRAWRARRAAAPKSKPTRSRPDRRRDPELESEPEIAPELPPPAAEAPPAPDDKPPFEPDIPIRTLEDELPAGPVLVEPPPPEPVRPPAPKPAPASTAPAAPARRVYRLPPTALLNEPAPRPTYVEEELKQIAGRIRSKFEEFNVLGSVVQINPGPVVTTFEFKPEAGIKYSRITTLTDDLCLGLQAESILIERIPGKPTVGIEVPNSRREVISLRQMLESEEFANSQSRLTIALGKDINGRIKVTPLESMPHLLIAGSTGSRQERDAQLAHHVGAL